MQAGSGDQGSYVERHRALARVQNEQLGPHEPQESNLIGHLEIREKGYVSRPLDGGEEQPSGELAYGVDAHYVVGLYALAVAAGGVGLGPQEQADVAAQVRVVAEGRRHRVRRIQELVRQTRQRRLGRRNPPSLDGWKPIRKTAIGKVCKKRQPADKMEKNAYYS